MRVSRDTPAALAFSICVTTGTMLSPSIAAAESRAVAILEEIEGASGKQEAFDELRAGERIELGTQGRAIIGYLGSCVRETIDGGAIVVGKEQSQVEGGKVARETIACEATQLVLSEQEAGSSATVTFRGPPWEQWVKQVIPSPSPVVLAAGKTLRIKRLDGEEDDKMLPLKNGRADLLAQQVALTPGGYYELSAGKKQMVIKIDPAAEAGPMPIMSRLVRL